MHQSTKNIEDGELQKVYNEREVFEQIYYSVTLSARFFKYCEKPAKENVGSIYLNSAIYPIENFFYLSMS